MSDISRPVSIFLVLGWLLALCALCVYAPAAFAQSSGAVATDGGFQRIMNGIVRGTPGTTNVPITGGGVRTTSTGTVGVTSRGISVNVPTSVVADFSRRSIIKGAARVAVRAVPWVGTAVVVNDIANAVKDSGIKTCPPPAFFCIPGTATPGQPYAPIITFPHASVAYPSVSAQCSNRAAIASIKDAAWSCTSSQEEYPYLMKFTCKGSACGPDGRTSEANAIKNTSCYTGDRLVGEYCVPATVSDPSKEGTPVPPDLLEQELEKAAARDAEAAARWKRNMDILAQANPAFDHPVDTAAQPVTVTATPVSAPPKVVSTETVPNADGTTSTKTVTEEVKVTPSIGSPSTATNPNVTFPSTTTTTTKVTNNVTNKTEIITRVETNPSPPMTPEKLDLPTDYNREVTQKSILDILDTWNKPITTELPDGNAEADAIQAKNTEGLSVVTGITPETVNVKNWFPSVPTAACVDPQVPVPLGGGTVTFPICTYVKTFSNLISGVIAFFCILGCVHQVQSALKA